MTKLKNVLKKKTNSKKNSNTQSIEQNNIIIEKKDEALEYINTNREILENEILSAPKIILKELEGKLLNGKEIIITASGMIGGRNTKDGVTIFGKSNNKENFKPDFELNYEDDLKYPYIFAVYYLRETKNYCLRAYSGKESDNRLLYVKLDNVFSLPLKQKEIISTGNAIFEITPIENNKIEVCNLSQIDSKKIFDPNNIKEVTIGRDKKCTFSFPKDKSFSRCQTTFSFDDNKKEWIIIDGSKTKSSTNGTWVFGTHSFPIVDQLTIEILTSKIIFTVRRQNNS
jgi:hypothetical protein